MAIIVCFSISETSKSVTPKKARTFSEDGQRREDVADLFKVGRVTLYRALNH